jgi:hypothetical protein
VARLNRISYKGEIYMRNIIECTEKDLDMLYDDWALTFEGTTIDNENLDYLVDFLKQHDCEMLKDDFYVISGRLMNSHYHLTGDNAYPDSLIILSIKLSDLSNVESIALPRFEIGGRWFTDIVNNNALREERN